MVFVHPVLITVRVPAQAAAPLQPFVEAGEDAKKAVAARLGIEPVGVTYQVLPVHGDPQVVVEITKIYPARGLVSSGGVHFAAGDLMDVLEPIVTDNLPDGTRLDVFAETFKDDIDVRAHACTTVRKPTDAAERFRWEGRRDGSR